MNIQANASAPGPRGEVPLSRAQRDALRALASGPLTNGLGVRQGVVAALARRGLARVQYFYPGWRAELTPAGRAELARLAKGAP